MAIAALNVAAKSNKEIQTILTKLLNGEPTTDKESKDGIPILERIKAIVTSPTSWLKRIKQALNNIFNSNEIRHFSSITENKLRLKLCQAQVKLNLSFKVK